MKRKGEVYTVDARGIVLASAYDYFTDPKHKWFNAIDLKKRINSARTEKQILSVLDEIKPMNRGVLRDILRIKSEDFINAQEDLAVLEAF